MRGTYLSGVVVILLASGGNLRAGGGKESGEDDLKKLQGTWKFVAQHVDGNARPPEQIAKIKITFTGDKWSVTDDGKVVQAGTHKLDPTKKPAQVDAVVTEGEGKGNTMLGIYELKGDMMKVNFDPQGKERPTNLTGKAGQMAVEIKRDK